MSGSNHAGTEHGNSKQNASLLENRKKKAPCQKVARCHGDNRAQTISVGEPRDLVAQPRDECAAGRRQPQNVARRHGGNGAQTISVREPRT